MKDNKEFKSGFISIIGRPNVGKSTLLNNIVKQKVAIVSDKPQTTRNRIQGIYTDDNMQIVFVDTPGIHKPKDKLGETMMKAASGSFSDMDIVFYVVDINSAFGKGEQYIIERLPKNCPVFLIINKIDLVGKEKIMSAIVQYKEKFPFREIVPVSALQKSNVDELLAAAAQYLEPGPKYYPDGEISDQPETFIMAEIIREKVLLCTEEEVPHSVAVVITDIARRSEELLYIAANIYAERSSQKGILIGKSGAMLKKIGFLARQDLTRIFGGRIFLDLRIKTRKNWRDNEELLKNFGLSLEE